MPTSDTLIKISPGVGKTHGALENLVPYADKKKILFLVPTGDVVNEAYEKARQTAINLGINPKHIRKIRGRTEGKEPLKPGWNHRPDATCYRMEEVREIARKGYAPGLNVCPECPHDKVCPYKKQFEDMPLQRIIIATHEVAKYLELVSHIVIIDENPVKAYYEEHVVSLESIQNLLPKIPLKSAETINKMIKSSQELLHQAVKCKQGEGRIYADPRSNWSHTEGLSSIANIPKEEWDLLDDHLSVFEKFENEKPIQHQRRLIEENITPLELEWMKIASGYMDGIAYIRADHRKEQGISFVYNKLCAPDFEKAKNIICQDATGIIEELQALLPRRSFKLVDAAVDLPGRKYHLKYALGKTAVVGDGNKCTPMKDQHIRSKLKKGIECLSKDEQHVLIITHMAAEERVLQLVKEIDPDREYQVTHFWGNRGINRFETCDAVICFGTPTANPEGLKDMASCLFNDVEKEDAWVADLGIRELVQSIHRIRPIYRPKSIIVMGQHWPESLGKPDFQAVQYNRGGSLDVALQRLRPILEKAGIVTREIACLAGVFCRQDSEHIHDWKRVRETLIEFVPFHIRDTLIGKGTNSKGDFVPVKLTKNSAWSDLINTLMLETGLPEIKCYYKDSPGKPSRGVGTISAARKFYHQVGLEFDAESWSGVEAMPSEFYEAKIQSYLAKIKNNVWPFKFNKPVNVQASYKSKKLAALEAIQRRLVHYY